MAAFDYIALDTNGRRRKGVIEADSARQTRQLLREQSLTPITVEAATQNTGLRSTATPHRRTAGRISSRDISVLTRQLATLVQAGLPVESALQTLSRQHENAAAKSMLAAVRAQVLEGQTLADALAQFPRSFSELYRMSVHAGERSGHLGMVLETLADFTERTQQARQKILLAALYPAILFGVSLLIIVFLLAFIVPDMVRVFVDAGQSLPLLTRGLIGFSHAVQHYGILVPPLFIAGIIWLRRRLKNPTTRLRLDQHMLRWPLLGKLILLASAARFSSTLGMLQQSGVPLLQAMEIAGAVLQNRHLRARAAEAALRVREGVSLTQAMEQSGIFPPVLITMIASGEASGTLGTMLGRASTMQQRDLENRMAVLLGLFEPLVILFMGGLVLLLVLAIILPILNLNQLV